MKNILFLGNSDVGLYKFRKELIDRLLEEQYEVSVSTPYGEYIPQLEKMGCNYIPLEYDRAGKNIWKEGELLKKYCNIIKKDSYDAVLLYTIKPTLYAGVVCRMRKVPYIVTITGLNAVVTRPGIMQKMIFFAYRRILPFANRVFFQNIDNLHFFQSKKVLEENAELVPGSGVNMKEHCYEPYQEGEIFQILFIGRIIQAKGIDELLEAIDGLYEKCKSLRFEFIGECDAVYKEKVMAMNCEGKIIYHGFCDCPHEYIKRAQAVIMPSYGEGMSNVLLEASACGRPILASDVPGCRDIVRDGITGFLFPSHSVDAVSYKNLTLPTTSRV